MTITAFAGPMVANFPGEFTANDNPEVGPSLFGMGAGLLDLRPQFSYNPGQAFGAATCGWIDSQGILVINQVPSTLAANNIAAAQVPVSGTKVTLVSSSGAGITVGVSITNAAKNTTVTGLLAIDGAMGTVTYGQAKTVQLWDPTKAIARAVRVVSSGDDSGGTFTISGYDIYGFPMTQVLTGAATGTATTTKAFKYIASVLPGGTMSGSNITIGTTDVYGLPVRSDTYLAGGAGVDQQIYWNNALITSATGYTAAVTTSPATGVTGDVRGTYATQSASDGTKRLVIYASPSLANIATAVGMTGVAQF